MTTAVWQEFTEKGTPDRQRKAICTGCNGGVKLKKKQSDDRQKPKGFGRSRTVRTVHLLRTNWQKQGGAKGEKGVNPRGTRARHKLFKTGPSRKPSRKGHR